MKKDLIEAYTDYQDSLFDDDYTKLKLQNKLVDIFTKYTKEEIKEEISNLESYIDFLKKQNFYTHEYKFIEEAKAEIEELAFNPIEIYRLYLEKDLAIYSVLSQCTDDYLKEVIKVWVAYEYDAEAIMLVVNYMDQKKRFSDEKSEE